VGWTIGPGLADGDVRTGGCVSCWWGVVETGIEAEVDAGEKNEDAFYFSSAR